MINKRNTLKTRLLAAFCILFVLPTAVILFFKMEKEKPSVNLNLSSGSMGASWKIGINLSDMKSGVRSVRVSLQQGGLEKIVLEKEFPSLDIIRGGVVKDKRLSLSVEPLKLGLKEGQAIITATVRDYSWRSFLQGNLTYMEKSVPVDLSPPRISVFPPMHYLARGGSGLVVYRLSEPCIKSGVRVGDSFFPGQSGAKIVGDESIHLALITVGYDQSPDTEVVVEATDHAGNKSKAGFPHHIKKNKFKTDIINISDRFLNWKMPEFSAYVNVQPGATNVEKFLEVNRVIRNKNFETIISLVKNTHDTFLFKGAFLRLPKSARRANFADHRIYKYKGKEIDRQTHLGIDLASLSMAPVPASNSGKAVFAGEIGIYGKTVIIDHGLGLFSLYSHLSDFKVKEGDSIEKGEVIGHTGTTGLAGGDHLHLGIMVHDKFVNPVEWWDGAWIKNNVTDRIAEVRAMLKKTE